MFGGDGLLRFAQFYWEGIEWYTKSAQADDPSPYGMCQLGQMYYDGDGVTVDYEKAFDLFSSAVAIWQAKNSPDVFYPITVRTLGDMYKAGKGVEKDADKAAEYYAWASELEASGQ